MQEIQAAVVALVGVYHGLDEVIGRNAGVEALHDEIGKGDGAGITHHAVGFVPHEVPHREVSLLLVNVVERLDKVVDLLRMHDGSERHGGAVGIPEAPGGVVLEVSVTHGVVGAAVVSIHIVKHGGGNHGMIESRVEDGLSVGIGRCHLHLAQLRVPGLASLFARCFEVPAGELGLHVGAGAFHRDGRESHLHEHFLCGVGVAQTIVAVFSVTLHVEGLCRAGQLGPEENLLVPGPAGGIAVTAEGCHLSFFVSDEFEAGIGGLVPAAAVLEVKDHGGVLGGGERIAVQAHAGGGGHLGHNLVTLQRNAVVTGLGHFLGTKRIAAGAFAARLYRTRYGHDGHVEQVSDTGSGKMHVAEADDRRITVVITGAPVPLLRNAGRAHLYQAEGNVGSHEHVAMATGSNLGIYVQAVVFFSGESAAGSQGQGGEQ